MDKDLFLINLVKRKVLSSLLIKTVVGRGVILKEQCSKSSAGADTENY